MKPSDLFGLFVRIVAFLIVLGSGSTFFWGLVLLLLGGPESAVVFIVIGGANLLVGLTLLFGAGFFVELAYPKDRENRPGSAMDGLASHRRVAPYECPRCNQIASLISNEGCCPNCGNRIVEPIS